jgi:hypothetical protein
VRHAAARHKAGGVVWRATLTVMLITLAACNGSVSSGVNNGPASSPPAPPTYPTPTGNGLSMPSASDEAATYTKWNWSWSASAEPSAVTEPITNYGVHNPDIHGDTEGDDLWTNLMMYRRSGNSVYLARAQAWARYFKEDYRAGVSADYYWSFTFDGAQYEYDHLYGWGLVAWYEHTALTGNPDNAALAEAERLAEVIETYWYQLRSDNGQPRFVPGQHAMAWYGMRKGARHLLLVTRVAEATQNPRWAALRDRLIDLWLQSPDWTWADAGHTAGMYYYGSWNTNESIAPNTNCKYDDVAGCPYHDGARIISTFQLGILTEAFDHAYRTTGRTQLVDRMVQMARYVSAYGVDPTYQYTGSTFGIVNGQLWHNYSANGPTTWWDPVYTSSLVNTLVRGYKYTGDTAFYTKAKHYFNRGTKGVYGSTTTRTAADNVAHHFVDTRFATASENFYFDYNKGELQYTYLLFENGGLAAP